MAKTQQQWAANDCNEDDNDDYDPHASHEVPPAQPCAGPTSQTGLHGQQQARQPTQEHCARSLVSQLRLQDALPFTDLTGCVAVCLNLLSFCLGED